MKKLLTIIIAGISFLNLLSQNIPEGYILHYQQDFSKPKSVDEFRFSVPESLKTGSEKNKHFIELNNKNLLDSAFQPAAVSILDNFIFGDFILEANIKPVGETNAPYIWVLLGIKDSLNYYCLNISPLPNDSVNTVYALLRGKERTISYRIDRDFSWNLNKWHKIRIERDIVNPSVKIYVNDMSVPYMEITDRTFIMGYVGFGVTSGAVRITDLKIWSQTTIPEPADFYLKYHLN